MMNYRIAIAGITYCVGSEVRFYFSQEDHTFFSENETERKVLVSVCKRDILPDLMEREVYRERGFVIGYDSQHNEVKYYYAHFLPGKPRYAVSCYSGDSITIYYCNETYMDNNRDFPIWNLLHMETILLEQEAFVFHCSYLMVQNKAILFSAPSGTGKTTQAKLWEKNIDGAQIINGDKCCIRKKEDGFWYACGYPFHGTAAECRNEDYPLAAIVVVRQCQDNYIHELALSRKLYALYSESTVGSWDSSAAEKMMDILLNLGTDITVIELNCNMDKDAAFSLQHYLKEHEVLV